MLNRLSIRYKIGFIALIGFLGFAVYQTATYRLSIDVRDQLQSILTQDFAILKFANGIQIQFAELDKGYQASLAEADVDMLHETDAKAMQMHLRFELLKTKYGIDDPLFSELFRLFESYSQLTSSHTAAVLADTLTYERTLSGYAQVNLLRERYMDMQQRFLEERYQLFEKQLIEIEKAEEALVGFGLLLGILLSLALILVSFIISRRLVFAFNNAVNVAEEIATGNLEQTIEITSKDETGQLLQSLLAMRDALKRQNEESYNRGKIQAFLAGLNELMRGDSSINDLSATILSYLAKQLLAQHGVLYIFDEHKLKQVAEYAKPINSGAPEVFALGETMVGQTALDLQARIIVDIPDSYMTIGSGIGRAAPRSIMLVPIVFEGQLKAVIEIAAFHRFTEEDLQMLQRCNDSIAIAINSAQARFEIADMLKKTQEQAHELQLQRQELALFNEQLEEKTQDLDRQKNEILDKNIALEESRKELIEKSEALELSGRYKSQFLSTMSHELRTPLNSILILSEALAQNRKSTLDAQDVQHAKVINTAGSDLLALINDILDLSKVEEGKMELLIEQVDVATLANSFTQHFEFQAKEKHLQFQVRVADDAPKTFFTDKYRLQQVIKNFISNAIKFTETGGVYIDFERPSARYLKENKQLNASNSLLIKVSDTGIGIDKSKQEQVFEAFKQADGTTSRKFGGTGLGLTISRELAKLLGGEIYLHSEGLGKGAEFAILLPVGDVSMITPMAAEPQLSINPATAQLTGHEKILVIEDNPVFQEVLKTVFSHAKLNVAVAGDGATAFDLLGKEQFDCLIVDLNLPDYDGLDLISEVRQNAHYQSVPIIVFTAEDVDAQRKKSILQYANQIATKTPKAVLEISQYVQRLLQASIKVHETGMLAGKTVLIVDDDERNLYSISSVLENDGVNILLARSGREALTSIEQNAQIDVVLLDIMMPEMDGYEVLQCLQEKQIIPKLPVIALTAKAMLGDKELCMEKGASAYLAKPVKPQVLLDTIVQLIA